jgi:hypothetical protein
LCSLSGFGQMSRLPSPAFNSYEIGGGFKAHFPAVPADRGFNYSQDSSEIYTANVKFGTYHFDVVAVKMSEPIPDDEKQDMLVGYMDFLKTHYDIDGTTGFAAGQKLLTHPTAKGTIDYWEDKDANNAVVMGWVDNDYMAVMILWGPGEYPYYDAQNIFLNGIRFPGDK